MPIVILNKPEHRLIRIVVTGKVVKDDYAAFGPAVDSFIRECGKLRILMEMHDFHGLDLGAAWEDIKFDMKHFSDIEKLAIVGETKMQEHMANWSKPFNRAKIEFFYHSHLDEARKWLAE